MPDDGDCAEFWWYGPLRKYGLHSAQGAAARLRAEGADVSIFRCPFCHRWHVGRPPSMEQLRDIADAIRARSGNAPAPMEKRVRRRERARRRKAERAERAAQRAADKYLGRHDE